MANFIFGNISVKKFNRFFFGVIIVVLFIAIPFCKTSAQPIAIDTKSVLGIMDPNQNPSNFSGVDPIFLPQPPNSKRVPRLIRRNAEPFVPASFDNYFYILCGLLLFVGFTLRAFPKYYSDLYRVFSQSGFRQKSIRDQLLQNKAASLGLNAIFFLTGGIYIYLVSNYKGIMPPGVWYFQIFICVTFLMVTYSVKYLGLMAGGWVFGARDLVNSYGFLVFFINKITGLVLLPVVVFLWLGKEKLHPYFVVFSFIAIGMLLLYRYFLILPMVRNRSGVSSFHFFIYLCTFEILPILLLVKFLVNFLNRSF